MNIADPVPSIILSNIQKVMNTQPEGRATANLHAGMNNAGCIATTCTSLRACKNQVRILRISLV